MEEKKPIEVIYEKLVYISELFYDISSASKAHYELGRLTELVRMQIEWEKEA